MNGKGENKKKHFEKGWRRVFFSFIGVAAAAAAAPGGAAPAAPA
jgi:hypothetical protein